MRGRRAGTSGVAGRRVVRSLVGQPRRALAEGRGPGSSAWQGTKSWKPARFKDDPPGRVSSSLWRAVEVRSRARMWVLFL